LFSVGSNIYNCFGDFNEKMIKQIEHFENIFIVDVVCGSNHCLSISNKGEIFGWGNNAYGQIGNGKSGEDEKQIIPIIKHLKFKKNQNKKKFFLD
jgi:alpha-tubulin suppressor-like RCC1 family protein